MSASSPIHVVQIVPRLDGGGAERSAADLVREHHQNAAAVRHSVVSEGGRLAADIIRFGGRFLPLPVASKNPLTAPWRAMRLRHTLTILRPDIVHVRSRVPAWLHFFANRQLQFPTVATAHGINSVGRYSKIMTAADTVICPGQGVADHLRRHYGAENTVVIPRGIDIGYFNPDLICKATVARMRQQWNLEGKKVLLHVGRLTAQKGHEILLHALAKLPPEFVALVVGGGDAKKRKRLAALARRLGVGGRLILAGDCAHMREIYALADIALSCAVKPESFGRSMAEALAMGAPVLAADHGGARDILADEPGGRLVPPADAEALAAALREPPPDASSSRARIQSRFTAARMAAQTLEVYRNVLAARQQKSRPAAG